MIRYNPILNNGDGNRAYVTMEPSEFGGYVRNEDAEAVKAEAVADAVAAEQEKATAKLRAELAVTTFTKGKQ